MTTRYRWRPSFVHLIIQQQAAALPRQCRPVSVTPPRPPTHPCLASRTLATSPCPTRTGNGRFPRSSYRQRCTPCARQRSRWPLYRKSTYGNARNHWSRRLHRHLRRQRACQWSPARSVSTRTNALHRFIDARCRLRAPLVLAAHRHRPPPPCFLEVAVARRH